MVILRCYYVLFLFYADVSFSVNSLSLGGRFRGDCTALHLPRGTVRLRQRRRFAMFQCYPGYLLLGQMYSSCVNHKWDAPIPACIKQGCAPFPSISNGLQYLTHGGAAIMYFCNPGYRRHGSQVIFCDGKSWNSTQPTCVGLSAFESPPLSCDFESQDLCLWTQDLTTNSEWHRISKKTPSGVFGTGPSYDHTKGIGYDGHYMYIESSVRRPDKKPARLISPLYRANLTTDGCLDFYYHMFGRHTGTLRVIMKPENIDLQSILSDELLTETYVLFERTGNRGDYWLHQTISLNEIDQNFQIIFEGSRGTGFLGDIAIDDVSLLQGPLCAAKLGSTTTEWINEPTGLESCQNRCGAVGSAQSPDDCQCYDGCLENNSCCNDYQDVCLFSTTAEDNYDTSMSSTTVIKRVPTPHPMLPPSLKMTATERNEGSNRGVPESTRKHADPQTSPSPTPRAKKNIATAANRTTLSTTPTTLATRPKATTTKAATTTRRIYTPRRIVPIATTSTARPKLQITKTTPRAITPTTVTLTTRQIHFVTPKTIHNATGRIFRGPVGNNVSFVGSKGPRPINQSSTNIKPTTLPVRIFKPHRRWYQFTSTLRSIGSTTKPPKVTMAVPHYSRTFDNYHEFVHRKTLKDDVETIAKSREPFEKSMAVKDAAVRTNGKHSSGTVAAAVTIPLLILLLVVLEITKRGRNSIFRRIHHKTMSLWDVRRRGGQPSEVRYLTGEEEVDLD